MPPQFADFDLAPTDDPCPIRFTTTVPTQSLSLLNSDYAHVGAEDLAARLKAKQDNMPRNRSFANYIKEKSRGGLSFICFVTWEKKSDVLPAVAEAKLIEQFYKKYKKLPELNKKY